MAARLRIGALHGGGLVLGWRCTSHCRHCLYGCGPHRRDGQPSPDELEVLLDQLADRAPRARFHIGGGEPTRDRDLLVQAIAGFKDRGLALEYVETNAAWVSDQAQAEAVLSELSAAGLACVLVSVSPFHAEHIAFDRTRALIAAAERVLRGGAFVWIPTFLPELMAHPTDRPLDLDGLIAERGDDWALAQGQTYGLVAAGRAGRYLARHGQRMDWRAAAGRARCADRLADTSHFHIDGDGLYVPGLCAGLAVPLTEVPGELDLQRYPVLRRLIRHGLTGLVEEALEEGFEPLEAYSGACDLCTHVRWFLFHNRPSLELAPAGFYDDRSLPDWPPLPDP